MLPEVPWKPRIRLRRAASGSPSTSRSSTAASTRASIQLDGIALNLHRQNKQGFDLEFEFQAWVYLLSYPRLGKCRRAQQRRHWQWSWCTRCRLFLAGRIFPLQLNPCCSIVWLSWLMRIARMAPVPSMHESADSSIDHWQGNPALVQKVMRWNSLINKKWPRVSHITKHTRTRR